MRIMFQIFKRGAPPNGFETAIRCLFMLQIGSTKHSHSAGTTHRSRRRRGFQCQVAFEKSARKERKPSKHSPMISVGSIGICDFEQFRG
mmetsp:Transcript_30992/g.51146  ORF Transcript_30992/g.51146 Transcript_30992/m.51146 type:complete len:89 (-) Transcript_30992:52-318(-)